MQSNRQKKAATLFQEELAEALRKESEENYKGILLSVTKVAVSPDLSVARVYVSIFPSKDKEKILSEIKEKTAQYRSTLARGIAKNMRKTPELFFYLDNSFEEMDKLNKAIRREGENPIT